MSYEVKTGENGMKYVTRKSAGSVFHMSAGNSKTGPAGNYNLPIEYTCKHDCECYKKRNCYACQGCYNFASNQLKYTENLNYFMNTTDAEFVETLVNCIVENKYSLVRYFTCGDIPNTRFINCIVAAAKHLPGVKFWLYTKKYALVNRWIDCNGSLPENIVIIFSHWLNDDGTYYPMDNRHNMPTSEFIPFGKEEQAKTVTHVCPCSDPTIKATCATCDHACYTLKPGESMALLEHSTQRTKERDKAIKAAKAAL